ncbi:MAG: hypothetical protein JJU11_18255 [Candidatus Sumerlaeia bacterium]|nr:hypothetical protein [Candidatus Sumerlaeia bacterium]
MMHQVCLERMMPADITEFFGAESLIVSRQRSPAAASDNIWEGWRNNPKKIFASYGDLIAGGKLEEVKQLVNLM